MSEYTYRTNRHRRRIPGAPAAAVREQKPLKAKHSLKTYANIQREANNFPWVRPIAEAIAKARLDLYNQDKWDKGTGWAEDIFVPNNPHPDLFDLGRDGELSMTPQGELLQMQDPDKFALMVPEVIRWMNDKDKSELRLLPMTREEAEAQGKRWYQTTDEYMQALQDLGYGDEQLFRDIANAELLRMLKEDLESGDPAYEKAMRHLLADDDYSYDPNDSTTMKRLYDRQRERSEFDKPNRGLVALGNTFAPISTRVLADPELNYKTGVGERLARGGADALLNAGYIFGPEWLATQAALRTGIGAGRALTGGLAGIGARAGTRAATGAGVGAGGYLYKHGLDPVFDKATGVGTARAPFDTRDLAFESALGGFNSLLSTQLLRGGKVSDNAFKLRSEIAPDNPSMVDYSDISDMFKLFKKRKLKDVGKEPGSVTAEEVTHISGADAKPEFVKQPIKQYRDKFGQNEAIQTESFPPMVLTDRAGDAFVIRAPFRDVPAVRGGTAIKGMAADKTSAYGGARRLSGADEGIWEKDLLKEYGPTFKIGERSVPERTAELAEGGSKAPRHLSEVYATEPTVKGKVLLYEKANDPRFANDYIRYNADFFKGTGNQKPFSEEQLEGLKLLMRDAQTAGSDKKQLFTGKPTVRNADEYAAKTAVAQGNQRLGDNGKSLANDAEAALLKTRTKYGTKDAEGNFQPGTKKQTKALEKGIKKSIERSNMNVKSKASLNKQRDYQGYTRPEVIAGMGLRTVGTQGLVNNANIMSNFIPYGLPDWSDTFGPRAKQMEYED